MSSQSRVTDYFVTTKKTDNNYKSDKNGIKLSTNESLDTKSSKCESIVLEKTPKRKQVFIKEKIKTSKRKKTPAKSEIIIEFMSNNEKNVESNESKSVEKSIQLNAKEVKEKLGKCNNLLELKKQLSTINDCAAKVKQFKEIKVKTPVKKLVSNKHNRSPSKHSPLRPLIATPIRTPAKTTPNKDLISGLNYKRRLFDILDEEKSSPTKANDNRKESLHAFERFSYLVNKPEENRSLVLPQKFKVLAEAFRCVDYIVSMLYKRQEICTFDKLKQSVEGMMRKSFHIKRLAQIETVLSDAFKFRYQSIGNHLDNKKSETKYQLTITPIYNSNIDIKLSSSHLLERYQSFVNRLLDITKEHHNNYINNLGVNIEGSELCRWHPKFKLDEVPDIVPNDNALPVEPKCNEKSAETFLQTSRQQLGLPTTDKTQITNNNDNQIHSNNTSEKIKKGLLKGLSMDLLNKIRAKEAANLALEMTRKPEVEKEIMVLRRLPELIRIIHSYFIGAKKLAIPFDDLINKIIDSYHCSLAILDARDHVHYMAKLLPDWIYVLEVKRGSYIKINKETSLSSLDERIIKRVNHLKNN